MGPRAELKSLHRARRLYLGFPAEAATRRQRTGPVETVLASTVGGVRVVGCRGAFDADERGRDAATAGTGDAAGERAGGVGLGRSAGSENAKEEQQKRVHEPVVRKAEGPHDCLEKADSDALAGAPVWRVKSER